MRKVILHYHLFKNAGTSLDAAFKENFSEEKGEWVTKEFPNQPAANREQVRQWILDNPQAKCFSSHTAHFPVPIFDDIEVFPVVFIRHPLDRIASAYLFEKQQQSDSFGAVLAKHTSLKGYIESRLSLHNDKQCRNFHCERISSRTFNKESSLLDNALETAKTLPFVGVVENFNKSIAELEKLLGCFGIGDVNLVAKEANVTRKNRSLEEKLERLENDIGPSTWSKLKEANKYDLAFYKILSK